MGAVSSYDSRFDIIAAVQHGLERARFLRRRRLQRPAGPHPPEQQRQLHPHLPRRRHGRHRHRRSRIAMQEHAEQRLGCKIGCPIASFRGLEAIHSQFRTRLGAECRKMIPHLRDKPRQTAALLALAKLQNDSVATAAFGTAARQIVEDLARELEESTASDFPFSRRQYSTVRRRNVQQVMIMNM